MCKQKAEAQAPKYTVSVLSPSILLLVTGQSWTNVVQVCVAYSCWADPRYSHPLPGEVVFPQQ